MILVSAIATVHLESVEKAKALAQELMNSTRLEPGCRSYTFYVSVENPAKFFCFEEWDDTASLERHLQQEHVRTFFAEITPLLTAPPEIVRYSVGEHGPL